MRICCVCVYAINNQGDPQRNIVEYHAQKRKKKKKNLRKRFKSQKYFVISCATPRARRGKVDGVGSGEEEAEKGKRGQKERGRKRDGGGREAGNRGKEGKEGK